MSVILDHLGADSSVGDIETRFPELTREQILGAIRYCHELIERTELEPA